MHTSFKNSFPRALVRPAIFLWLLPVVIVFLAQCCDAQQSLSLASPNRALIGWTSGPADASLGKLADIKIPKDYRFTDAAGASDLLRRMNNPIPQGLVGILAPESGQWWAVLTYKDIGYVKDADKDQIDAAAILKTVSDRAQRQNDERAIHGLPPIIAVEWKLPPVFDAKTHTVEWAVQVKIQSTEVINHTMRLLGRQGVLDATVVEPYQAGAGLAPLKELMKNISFKTGQRYTDYQKGDTVASIGLAGLIAGQDDSVVAPKNAAATATKSAGSWGWYGYVGVGVLAGGGTLLLRVVVRQRRHKTRRTLSTSPVRNGIGNGDGVSGEALEHQRVSAISLAPAVPDNGPASVGVKPSDVKLGEIKPKESVARKETVARKGSKHRRGARRKRIFDYHRFYTDTVMKLSSGTYAEVSASSGRANGNGHANSHSFDQPSQPPTQGDMNQAIVQAHLDLIANQKELIEEQKRLMIQQAKLIEEKSKLIAEKSQLLDRQAELFERDLL